MSVMNRRAWLNGAGLFCFLDCLCSAFPVFHGALVLISPSRHFGYTWTSIREGLISDITGVQSG